MKLIISLFLITLSFTVLADYEVDGQTRIKIKIVYSEDKSIDACKRASEQVKANAKKDCSLEGFNSIVVVRLTTKKLTTDEFSEAIRGQACKAKVLFHCSVK